MATEYLRNKLDTVEALIAQEEVAAFQHSLIVADAETSTGDDEVDAGLRAQATNSRKQLIAAQRRLETRKKVREELRAEQSANEVKVGEV